MTYLVQFYSIISKHKFPVYVRTSEVVVKTGSFYFLINADGIAAVTGELLSANMFVYCKDNPTTLKDPSGFRPIFTEGEETEAMREASLEIMSKTNKYNYQSKASSTKKNSFNTGASALKSAASGFADTASGKTVSNIIKEREVFIPPRNTIITSVSSLSKGARAGKRILGLAGSIGFSLLDINKSYQQGEYVGIGIDIASAAAGVGIGFLVGLGTAAVVTASTPILVVGALGVAGFALTTGIGVGIDKYATYTKDVYYGR